MAQEEWELVKDENEVKIYARKIKGFTVKAFKGTCIIDQPIEIVGAVLFDIPAYTKWFHKCREIKKVPRDESTDLDFILYIIIGAPWPLWDRDIIYKTNVVLDIASGKVKITGLALEEPFVPIKEDYVRINDSEFHWVLEAITIRKTKVTFSKRTDIAGSAVAYLSNLGSKMTILDSLTNLRIIAAEPKYSVLGEKLRETYTKE